MGVDIHSFIEYKREDGKWNLLDVKINSNRVYVYDSRDYELFGALASVRGEGINGFTSVRGLPADVSEEVLKAYEEYEDCYFSPTWYDLYELKLCYAENKDLTESWLNDGKKYHILDNLIAQIEFLLNIGHIYYPKPGEVRFICWFDC